MNDSSIYNLVTTFTRYPSFIVSSFLINTVVLDLLVWIFFKFYYVKHLHF